MSRRPKRCTENDTITIEYTFQYTLDKNPSEIRTIIKQALIKTLAIVRKTIPAKYKVTTKIL